MRVCARLVAALLGMAVLGCGAVALGADAGPAVQSGDLVAITGDSITEQKIYSVDIEAYLLMCSPVAKVRAMQFGWSGDTSWGFLGDKLVNDVLRFKPTVMTTCFGMNDGGYKALTPDVADRYRAATQKIIDTAKKGGVRTIVLGTPGAVDGATYHKGNRADAEVYNETLAGLGAIDKELAEKNGLLFADVHGAMMEVQKKGKAKYGEKYSIGGGDGVHPGPNGHLVMAYAFLKAMGFDGNIGTFTVDMAAHKADVSEGHKLMEKGTTVTGDGATLAIESTRYPFCFYGKGEDQNVTGAVVDFFPFNEDLNRLTLVVKNATSEKLKVTWGKTSKEFAAADLAKGINLAAEFQDNPFCKQFVAVTDAIKKQHNFETPFIKSFVYTIPGIKNSVQAFAEEDDKAAIDRMEAAGEKKDGALFKDAADLVTPVEYTLTVEAVK